MTALRILTAVILTAFAGGCGGGPSSESQIVSMTPWPSLPETGFIAGRPATQSDMDAGDAVFVAKAGEQLIGRALNIDVPQFAIFVDAENHERTRVIIIQAEQAGHVVLVGYREVDTGTTGVATLPEFELLGRDVNAR